MTILSILGYAQAYISYMSVLHYLPRAVHIAELHCATWG